MQLRLKFPIQANVEAALTCLRRFLPVAVLALALMSLSLLVACGGGNGGEASSNGAASTPSAPAATPAAPAATPAAGGDAGAAPATGSGSEVVFVIARGFEVFELNLTAGDNVSVTYSSLGRSSGGITTGGTFAGREGAGSAAGDVILVVLNPVEDQVLSEDRTANNTVEFVADVTGTYQFVFSNPYPLQGLEITVDYTIS